jgi:hypothetical protein
MPVIPALGRPRQEDLKFKGSLGYIARPYLKKRKKAHTCNPSYLGDEMMRNYSSR